MKGVNALRAELDAAGFWIERDVVDEPARARLLELVGPERVSGALHHRSGVAFAVRGLLEKVPGLRSELVACGIDVLAAAALGEPACPIDATYFDKHAAANWTVPAHQDRIMPVADEAAPGRRVRDGVGYAEPDPVILSELLALRIHFDATDGQTGALRLLPGSHTQGVLTDAQIRQLPLEMFRPCAAKAGDVLLMRPLLLHRSSPSTGDGHRRVLHVVYAAAAKVG